MKRKATTYVEGDGEPGVKAIWQGVQRVMDFAAGLENCLLKDGI